MMRFLGVCSLLAVSVAGISGCGESTPGPASEKSGMKSAKTTYICHMGADCGKAEVATGEKVPSCCGKVMVKADTYSCSCGKTKIIEAGKPAPECCGAAMRKIQP